MNDYPERALVWADVETTGLDSHDELLLEVACLVTDLDLNVLDDTGFQAKILWPAERLARARAQTNDFVRAMHDRTGLWAACSDPSEALPVDQVDTALTAYVKRLVPEARTARMGGNSIRLDLNFADQYLPAFAAHLHYRMLDVSSWVGPAQWWAGVPEYPKARNHTAMADIRESIAEMRYLRSRLGLDASAAQILDLGTVRRRVVDALRSGSGALGDDAVDTVAETLAPLVTELALAARLAASREAAAALEHGR